MKGDEERLASEDAGKVCQDGPTRRTCQTVVKNVPPLG